MSTSLRNLMFAGLAAVVAFPAVAGADGWNPFKKKSTDEYRPVIPANAQVPMQEKGTFRIPSFTDGNGKIAPAAFIDQWNRGAQQSMERMRKAITLPKIQLPSMTVNMPGNVQNENPFLQPLLNKLPFPGASQPAKPRKKLLPAWLTGKPERQQPPTLQDWLGQPRPQ